MTDPTPPARPAMVTEPDLETLAKGVLRASELGCQLDTFTMREIYLAMHRPAMVTDAPNLDTATDEQIQRANAAVEANLKDDGTPKWDSAQGYACALTAIMQTDLAMHQAAMNGDVVKRVERMIKVYEQRAEQGGRYAGEWAADAKALRILLGEGV